MNYFLTHSVIVNALCTDSRFSIDSSGIKYTASDIELIIGADRVKMINPPDEPIPFISSTIFSPGEVAIYRGTLLYMKYAPSYESEENMVVINPDLIMGYTDNYKFFLNPTTMKWRFTGVIPTTSVNFDVKITNNKIKRVFLFNHHIEKVVPLKLKITDSTATIIVHGKSRSVPSSIVDPLNAITSLDELRDIVESWYLLVSVPRPW